MLTKRISGVEKPLSRLVYGTSIPPIQGEDKESAFELLDLAREYGFTTFDTAYAYGNAESNLGEWMEKRGARAECVILDKGCNPRMIGSLDEFSASFIKKQVNTSLARLRTDRVEIYILHRDDPSRPVDEIVEALNELKAEGKIGVFGGSNWTRERMEQANEYAYLHGLQGFSVYSPCYSLVPVERDLWGGSVRLSGVENKEYREKLAREQTPVFAYSALARGYLSGKFRVGEGEKIEDKLGQLPILEYDCDKNREILHRAQSLADKKGVTVPRVALAWLLYQKLNVFPLVSPSKREHFEDNVRAFTLSLSDEEMAELSFE